MQIIGYVIRFIDGKTWYVSADAHDAAKRFGCTGKNWQSIRAVLA